MTRRAIISRLRGRVRLITDSLGDGDNRMTRGYTKELSKVSNCHVEELLEVYKCIVKDAICVFPQLEEEFRRDLVRLRRVSQARGILLFTVDLPAIGKHLDRCVAEEQYTLSSLPFAGRYSTRTPFPCFLRGLLLLIFEESGQLRKEDLDVEAYVFAREFLYCGKNVKLPCPLEATYSEVESYLQADAALPKPKEVWAKDTTTETEMRDAYRGFQAPGEPYLDRLVAEGLPRPEAILFLRNLDFVSGFLSTTLGSFNPSEWRFRHGPGAIAERTGPVNKFHWSNWSSRLEERFPIADHGFTNYGCWADSDFRYDITSTEAVSRLIAVPKTALKPRLIAAEPSENQWCQQNLRCYLQERCEETWIGKFVRFNDQTFNQHLCKVGSTDGSLLTCDLSAASDSVTCDVVGHILRGNPRLLCHLQAVRTRFLSQEINTSCPREIELRMFSTMGSACTFPIECLVFSAITLAAALSSAGLRANEKRILALEGKVAVYGDDIIAPCDSWAFLQKALSALHFKVNASKSFATGKFRESCGVDSFRGVDVTPVYWKGICRNKPESIVATLATSNNFHRKFFLNVAERVRSTIPCDFVTVAMDSGVEGKKSFVRPSLSELARVRWNWELQRTEVATSTVKVTCDRLEPYDDTGLLQYFTEQPDPLKKWSAGVALCPVRKVRPGWIALDLLGLQGWA